MKKSYMGFALLVMFCLLLNVSQALAAFDSASENSSKRPLKLLRITPSGEDVPASRQIVFTFSRPVVPVGRMERDASEVPVTIKPALECEWRWLNTTSLACQLSEKSAMAPATRYTITMEPGITTEDGATIAEPISHTFITERPKVVSYWFNPWESPGRPVVGLYFNQPVTASSVASHIYFITSTGRRVLLSVEEDPYYVKRKIYKRGRIWLVKPAGSPGTGPTAKGPEDQTDASGIKKAKGLSDQGRQGRDELGKAYELPVGEPVELRIEPGLASMDGPEPGTEDRVVARFHTYSEFRFKGVRCSTNDGDLISISPDDKGPQLKRCDPLRTVYLEFSTPLSTKEISKGLHVTPDLAGGRKDFDPWANMNIRSSIALPTLKAYETYRLSAEADKITDIFGRRLVEDIAMEFFTDHRQPRFRLAAPYFVLEKNVDTEVPMVVTNIDKIKLEYETLTVRGRTSGKKVLELEDVKDIAYKVPLETRSLIPQESGAVKVRFQTVPDTGQRDPGNNWFFSQVTPYNVHVKVGHFNSLVWVTDFATGRPVEGVKVDIYRGRMYAKSALDDSPEVLAGAVTDSEGIARLAGTEKIDPKLEVMGFNWFAGQDDQMFVRCRKGDDMAIVPLVSQFHVSSGDAYQPFVGWGLERRYGHIHTWGTTAQGVYKAGDMVQYKIYVRNQDNKTFIAPPLKSYTLKVVDPMGKTVHEVKDITLSEFGSFDGEFKVAKTGAVGWYSFELSADFSKGRWEPIRVLVSDFTPAPFRVTTDLNGELFRSGDTVEVDTGARLHAGGPYVDAQTRVTARISPRYLMPRDPGASGFAFDVYTAQNAPTSIHQTEASLDEKGDLRSTFTIKDPPILYGSLVVESAVRDDRGKYVASQAAATYVGRDRFVGIRQKDWMLEAGKAARVEALVVNEQGSVASGTSVDIKVEYRKTTASRVKSAGNAYLTQYKHEWVAVHSCNLTSSTKPVVCEFTPEQAGTYRMTASIKDTRGRPHSSRLSSWAVGKGVVLWETKPGNALEVIPEKKEDLHVGDTARYMVQNPYPGARALITIERYGVIKSWVKTLESSTEIIEFPVMPEYLPGFYLSVVVMSPRVDKPGDLNTVDLGKPAFKIGYVRVPVKDPYKEIIVDVEPAKDAYKPRDKVRVDIRTAIRTSSPPGKQPPMELAVAVLDEAVLDLLQGGRRHFDPYRGFYYLESLDLNNFDLLMQLVGRQHFEKKGADTGGGAGMDIGLRSLFKFVSYWNPSVRTDDKGRASVEFEAPDNLTGWRVLVMAVTPTDRMGLGDAAFKVNRPTEIRPALPNQVTRGDSFEAGFSIMNRTDKKRTIHVSISARGPVALGKAGTLQSEDDITAEPYKRYKVWLPIKTTGEGRITFTVRAGDEMDSDALQKTLPVRKSAALLTAATYGTTVSDEVSQTIAFPAGMRTDVGRLSVTVSPSVIGNVEGAFEYMRDYPYACWEQKLGKGVMASHYRNLRKYIPGDFEWAGSSGLPRKTLGLAAEYQAPNGGMVYYVPEDRYVSPYLSAYTAMAFNWLRSSGYKIPDKVEERLHGYLQKFLRRDVMPSFYSEGMASTVRALALAALSDHGKITLADLTRYRSHVPEMSLFGKAHYLHALLNVPGTEAMRSEVVDMILAHSDQTGGKFIFSEALDSGYGRLLATPLRDNCAVLSGLLAYSETPQGSESAGEIPYKLVRTITQTRGHGDSWGNTQENIFCMNSLVEFSRVYEKERPDMALRAWLDREPMGEAGFRDFSDGPVVFRASIKKTYPGSKATVKLERRGSGRVYYATRLFYAQGEGDARSVNSGIEVHREYSVEQGGQWTLLKRDMKIKAGDLVRVDLYISLPSARNFVVVDDPVPGGLEPVNRELATASVLDAEKVEGEHAKSSFWYRRDDWLGYGYSRWSFYYKELRHHAVRFYSDYLPQGNYHLSYTAQAIAPGRFTVLPLRAEEMYEPDVFGMGLPATLTIEKLE